MKTRTVKVLQIEGTTILNIVQQDKRRTESKYYHLRKLETGYNLSETGTEGYDVNPEDGTCECMGHLRWGHCKHVDVLRKLKELGRIS